MTNLGGRMTNAEAAELQLKWIQQGDPPLCEHLKVELEYNNDSSETDTYRCTTCGRSVPR
jgi:hypothetical protein